MLSTVVKYYKLHRDTDHTLKSKKKKIQVLATTLLDHAEYFPDTRCNVLLSEAIDEGQIRTEGKTYRSND